MHYTDVRVPYQKMPHVCLRLGATLHEDDVPRCATLQCRRVPGVLTVVSHRHVCTVAGGNALTKSLFSEKGHALKHRTRADRPLTWLRSLPSVSMGENWGTPAVKFHMNWLVLRNNPLAIQDFRRIWYLKLQRRTGWVWEMTRLKFKTSREIGT